MATDANGVATFTDLSLDLPVGSWFLQFFDAKESLVSVGTTAIALSPGPIQSIVAWGVPDLSTISFFTDTLFPSVKIIDKVGNGIPGVQVTWTIPDGLSSLDNTNTKTDADGIAAAGRWAAISPNVTRFVIVATPTPSKIENSPLSLVASIVPPIGRIVPPTIPSTPR